jgi:hypothetical protein
MSPSNVTEAYAGVPPRARIIPHAAGGDYRHPTLRFRCVFFVEATARRFGILVRFGAEHGPLRGRTDRGWADAAVTSAWRRRSALTRRSSEAGEAANLHFSYCCVSHSRSRMIAHESPRPVYRSWLSPGRHAENRAPSEPQTRLLSEVSVMSNMPTDRFSEEQVKGPTRSTCGATHRPRTCPMRSRGLFLHDIAVKAASDLRRPAWCWSGQARGLRFPISRLPVSLAASLCGVCRGNQRKSQ